MHEETIKARIDGLLNAEPENMKDEARWLLHDVGAELPHQRIRLLRQLQAEIHSHDRGDKGQEDAARSFKEGVLYAAYHLCDGYISQVAPAIERRARREALTRQKESGEERGRGETTER